MTGFAEREMSRERTGTDAGFSLVELLVAMTITLIISGAIYGLLAGGQSAFRREPELTDRQQNARIAMSVIMRDIANVGGGMPPFTQTFRQGLNGPTGAPLSADNVATDEIEMLTNTGARENEPVCNSATNNTGLRLMRSADATSIPNNTVALFFMTDGTWTIRNINSIADNVTGAATANCLNVAPGHAAPNVATAGDPTGLNTSTSLCEASPSGLGTNLNTTTCSIAEVSFGTVVRYRIRNDAAGVPVLQRFSSDDSTAFTGGVPVGFQTVARGIEDLQIQYTQVGTPTTWVDAAPAVTNGDYTKLINQVRVTLVARSEARNIQGARTSASGRTNIRGSLTSIGAPRATLFQLANAPQASPSPSPQLWF